MKQRKEKKKKISIIITIIILLLSIAAITITVLFKNMVTKKDKTTQPEVKETEEQVKNEVETTRKEITNEKCYQNLCISSFNVNYINQEQIGHIQFEFTNKKEVPIEEGEIQITFDNGLVSSFHYPSMNSMETVTISKIIEGKEILTITDYEIAF